MNRVFVDTSALYALLVTSDEKHARARATFESLRVRDAALVTTSYYWTCSWIGDAKA